MKTKIMDGKNILLVAICLVSLAIVSCQSMMDRVTPCNVTEQAYQYVNDTLEGYKEIDSLYNVKKIRDKIIINHRKSLIDLKRELEDEGYAYDDAIGSVKSDIAEAEFLQGLVIGDENQQFSILGILAGMTGGAAIGRALKRKGDFTPTEHEEEVRKAKNVAYIAGLKDGKNGTSTV